MIAALLALALQCPNGAPPPCRSAARATAPATSLAVLYFDNASADSNDAYLADGITEEIISRLGEIGRLQVKSRYLVRRYRGGADQNPSDIGRQLAVASIVTGSVRRAGNRVRVTAEMVRASTGDVVWSDRYDRAATDVLSLEGDLASAVATAVAGRLLPTEQLAVAARPTSNAAAYDAYLLGRFYFYKRTAPDMVHAAALFQQAIRADSSFAQAWSGLADAYLLFIPSEYDVPGINPDSIIALADSAARRAIALNPRLGEAWTSLGEVLDDEGKRDESSTAFERAIVLSPQYVTAHLWSAFHFMSVDRWDEAVREAERARELDPTTLVNCVALVFAYDGADRWTDAEPVADQCRSLDRDHFLTLQFADFTHDAAHRHLERLPEDVRRLLVARNGTDTATAAAFRVRLMDPVRRDAAIQDLARSGRAGGFDRDLTAFDLWLAYGNDEAALRYLGDLADAHAVIPAYVINGMLGARRRADPRFRAAVARLVYRG